MRHLYPFIATVALASVCLIGCSADPNVTGPSAEDTSGPKAELSVDRDEMVLAKVPIEPHAAVCSGGAIRCFARVRTTEKGQLKAYATTAGLGAQDLASAYKLDTSVTPNATIAIVNAFGYPNVESDLAVYRSQFGLPACTVANGCLKIVNQQGQTSPLPAAPPAGDDWTLESALDLAMASAACPRCKLLLVQANDNMSAGLYVGQSAAVSLGATVISNSWGAPESPSYPATNYEKYFNHPGVATFVASGDSGYNDGGRGPDYPATSAYVFAVGGTTLTKSTAAARGWTEGTWDTSSGNGAGGSACSLSIPKPAWQTNSVCSKRASSDLAAVGNPSTGVLVYNAKNGGWLIMGGTSAAAPFVAGVFALTGHGKDTPSFPYANTSSFFDITSGGTNGSCGNLLCTPASGWDGPTGMGSPNGALLKGTPSSCTPSCSGKQCGSDGCGGSCGSCSSGSSCNSSGQCAVTSSCTHSICSTGRALVSSCDSCAQAICNADRYCCTTYWDSTCVAEVGSICRQSCR